MSHNAHRLWHMSENAQILSTATVKITIPCTRSCGCCTGIPGSWADHFSLVRKLKRTINSQLSYIPDQMLSLCCFLTIWKPFNHISFQFFTLNIKCKHLRITSKRLFSSPLKSTNYSTSVSCLRLLIQSFLCTYWITISNAQKTQKMIFSHTRQQSQTLLEY